MSRRECRTWATLLLLLALACSPVREEAATVAPDPTTPPTDASDVLRPTATPVETGREASLAQTYTPTGPPPKLDLDAAGVPVLVSYCPLCASAVVYDRRLDGELLVFGNTSALYESDMVMYDHQTGSYWLQVLGETIVGGLTGSRLTMLPSMTVAWGEWKQHHPDTLVLSADQRLPGYEGNPYQHYSSVGFGDRINENGPIFPTRPIADLRLRPGDRVFAIKVGDSHKAYTLAAGPTWLVNDDVGGRGVLILGREGTGSPSATAYFRQVRGRTLSFRIEGVLVQDQETGTVWDDTGLAVSGPLAGAQLDQVPSRTSFWFSVAGALPDIELHRP